jgi:hypothetical protein
MSTPASVPAIGIVIIQANKISGRTRTKKIEEKLTKSQETNSMEVDGF